jgi:tetratricopeptide (TPR) repeat protein
MLTLPGLALATSLMAAIPLPSFLHLPVWAERWLWNPRERTETALAEQDPKSAVRQLETAARLLPQDSLVQFNAGAGHLAADDAKAALPFLERSASGAAADLAPAAHYDLGNARFGAGDAAGAVEAFKQALRLDPAAADAKHNLELALRQLDKERQARKPREAPGGGQQGQQEQSQGQGQGDDSQQQPPQPDPENPQPDQQGAQQPPQGGPSSSQGQQQPKPLEGFKDQPDMTAQQAAAVLESVENLERQQRKAEAARRTRRRATGERDW